MEHTEQSLLPAHPQDAAPTKEFVKIVEWFAAAATSSLFSPVYSCQSCLNRGAHI